MSTVAQPSDNNQIEPFVVDPPVKYANEKQMAAHLKKVYGEAPVGMDLYDVWCTASNEEYRTKAEQDAAIHEQIVSQQPKPKVEYSPDAAGAWKRRGTEQNVIRVPRNFKDGRSSLDNLSPFPRPKWADPDNDVLSTISHWSMFRSSSIVATPLSGEHGARTKSGVWEPAHIQAHVARALSGAVAVVKLDRFGAVNEVAGVQRITDWDFEMTAAEATQLAHTLLAAVDLIAEGEVA
ncbi:hypothetical protein [Rhodococcoides fascians]|uniref:hypothetical protein n=1 Tax=Rhodococcoides fascians TaxID=1828 RepID=UPI000561DCFF|nr:hypothetical protein [Rhodococcus fascians]